MKKILCAMAIIFCLAGYTRAAEEKVYAPQDLPKAYAENPSEVRAQYLNKTVQIKGIVVDKGMSRYMTPYLALSENGEQPTPARCVLPYSYLTFWALSAQLDDFEIGQTVTISGRVHSLNENLVLLKESKAVE